MTFDHAPGKLTRQIDSVNWVWSLQDTGPPALAGCQRWSRKIAPTRSPVAM